MLNINYFIRHACSIEFDDKVVLTGGWKKGGDGLSLVAVYDVDGFVEYLPDLIVGRYEHGCGHYINSNNENVRVFRRRNSNLTTTNVCLLVSQSVSQLVNLSPF